MPKTAVKCSQCGSPLKRYLINPNTGKPIRHFFCGHGCKGKWQTAQREALGFTKEWLIDQYVKQGKGAYQIGREIGRDGKRVWEWLRDYGIETRGRGQDERQHFKKGHKLGVGNKYAVGCSRPHTPQSKEKIRQARLNDGHVPYLKDGKHWLHQEGSVHPNWKGGITPDRQAVYASEEWSEAVKTVWQRDDATCQRCGKHHNTAKARGTFHIHHIVSFKEKSLRTEPSNLVLLCRECHRWVHSRKNVDKEFIKETENE